MIGRKELRTALGNKPFVTKKEVRDALGYATYQDIRKFFYGLNHIGQRYLTEDVIDKLLAEVEYR